MYLPTAVKVVLAALPAGGLAISGYLFGDKNKSNEASSQLDISSPKTEYIYTLGIGGENKPVCLITKEEKEEVEIENCKSLAEEIAGKKENQPHVLLRSDKKSFNKDLRKYSLLLDGNSTEEVEQQEWKESKWTLFSYLSCESKSDSKNSTKAIASCNFLNENKNSSRVEQK